MEQLWNKPRIINQCSLQSLCTQLRIKKMFKNTCKSWVLRTNNSADRLYYIPFTIILDTTNSLGTKQQECTNAMQTNHHTYASHRLFTDEATVQYISMYVITYTYMYILERKTMLFQTRPQSMYCTVIFLPTAADPCSQYNHLVLAAEW